MRIRIPYPIQTWFNALGGGVGFPKHSGKPGSDEKLEAESPLLNPGVLVAIQDLCYEIFAVPNCSSEAISVAHTICGHIFDFAQHSNPAIQQLTKELLPTLVHVYLVLWTTSTNTNVINQSRGRINLLEALKHEGRTQSPQKKHKHIGFAEERTNVHARLRNKMRKKILNHRVGGSASGGGSSSLFAGLNPTTNAAKGGELQVAISTSSTLDYRDDNLGTLSAILEACILGLYNTYVIAARLRQQQKTPSLHIAPKCMIPPFSEGSIFSGKSPSSELSRLLLDCADNQIGQSLDGTMLTPTELTQKSSLGSISALPWERLSILQSHHIEMHVQLRFLPEDEINAKNRMSVLRFLCRNYIDQMTSVSPLSREALCSLAIILGPYGLRHHYLPNRLIPKKGSNGRPWNRFRRGQRSINDQFNVDVANIVAASAVQAEDEDDGDEDDMDDDDDDDDDDEDNDDDDDDDEDEVNCRPNFITFSDIHSVEDIVEYLDRTDSLLSSPSGTCSVLSLHSNNGSFVNSTSEEDFERNDNNNNQSGKDPVCPESRKNNLSNVTDSVSEMVVTANSLSHSPLTSQQILPPPPLTEGDLVRKLAASQIPELGEEDKRGKQKTKGTNHQRRRRSRSRKKRPSFGLKSRNSKPSSLSSSSRLARIPNISSGLVIDLLPGLHFLLGTEQAPLAARAILAISLRADFELWADVLLYLNGILNSQLYRDAVANVSIVDPGQNQSNLIFPGDGERTPNAHKSTKKRLTISRPPFPSFSSSFAKKESKKSQSTLIHPTTSAQYLPPCKPIKVNAQPLLHLNPGVRKGGVITNASFQSIRPPEDIPVINVSLSQHQAGDFPLLPQSPQMPPVRPNFVFSEDLSRREDEEESHSSSRHPTPVAPTLPPYFQQKLPLHPSPSSFPAVGRRTQSFNVKFSGSQPRRVKIPSTVTFADPPAPSSLNFEPEELTTVVRTTAILMERLSLMNKPDPEKPNYSSSL